MLMDLVGLDWTGDDYLRMMDGLKSVVKSLDRRDGEVRHRNLGPYSRLHRQELGRKFLAFR